MAAKQYVVVRPFRRTDPRTGADTVFGVGDDYTGPVDKPYLTDAPGPDGKGPLIAEKSVPTTSDSSTKEN